MTKIYNYAHFGEDLVSINEAKLSVASSAVLYGLSVYTVFPASFDNGEYLIFCLTNHYKRLINSSKIIGIDFYIEFDDFVGKIVELLKKNEIKEKVFVRASVHVNSLLPGTRSRGLETVFSMFIYEAKPIVSQDGIKLKTSSWRRVPDTSIPSRAKVNGAYVNSVLGKQDALDSGYDDCLFLDQNGHICESSASNIFLVRNNILITPNVSSDILEGINRGVVLEIAKDLGIKTEERNIDLTEIYIADEVFLCGTSAFVAPVFKVDNRKIGEGIEGEITKKIKKVFEEIWKTKNNQYITLKT